ncbi:hypothetical protein T07_13304, partial [Trichinella nelsoni]
LWMVGGGGDVLAAQHFVECGPCVRAELPASVGGYTAGNAKTRDPVGQEGSSHRRRRDVMDGPSFRPPGEPVDSDGRARSGARVGGTLLAVSACVAAKRIWPSSGAWLRGCPGVTDCEWHGMWVCVAVPAGCRLRDFVQLRVYTLGSGHIGCNRVVQCRREKRVDAPGEGVSYHVAVAAYVAYVVCERRD